VSFVFVVKYVERMLDRAWSLAVAEIEKQKNDQATTAIDRSIRSIFRFSPCAERNDHASKRQTGKRVNGVEGLLVVVKVGNHHLVDETSETVLHNWCGPRQKGNVKLRRVRVAGKERS
jgi:hypothetical protein